MKIHPAAQGTAAWMEARAVMPTASEFDNLITPTGKIRKGQMVESYLARKLAEKWLQGPLPGFGSWAMDQGRILEERAIPWYEMTFNRDIERVGLITNNAGTFGCSPDGLLRPLDGVFGGGIEIKCPEAPKHVSYLLAGEVPADYIAQVQGGMLVAGVPCWQFISYHSSFPKLVLVVDRNLEFHKCLTEALESFIARLAAGFDELCDKNGGPPPKREPMVFADEMRENFDVIP